MRDRRGRQLWLRSAAQPALPGLEGGMRRCKGEPTTALIRFDEFRKRACSVARRCWKRHSSSTPCSRAWPTPNSAEAPCASCPRCRGTYLAQRPDHRGTRLRAQPANGRRSIGGGGGRRRPDRDPRRWHRPLDYTHLLHAYVEAAAGRPDTLPRTTTSLDLSLDDMTRASMAGCRPVRRHLLASAGSANFTTVLRPQWTELTLAHRRQAHAPRA